MSKTNPNQLSLFEQEKPSSKKEVSSPPLTIYIDGASRGNPGQAGAGFCIMQEKKVLLRGNGFLGVKTNNQAEYLALALALFHIKDFLSHDQQSIIVRSDSLLLVSQMKGVYAIKNPFIKALQPLIKTLKFGLTIQFQHVPREQNKIADAEANKAVDNRTPLPETFKKLIETL